MTARVEFVCVATPTVMDGTVVRWYADLAAHERGEEVASASRNGVRLAEDVHPRIRDAAEAAHRELARNRDADVRHYTTHTGSRRDGLVPVGGV
jgi:hypothetical protein